MSDTGRSSLSSAAILGTILGLGHLSEGKFGGRHHIPEDPLAGVDIEAEYALIQEKRSSLSRSRREMVVARYEQAHRTPQVYRRVHKE